LRSTGCDHELPKCCFKKTIPSEVANTWTKITARYGYAMVTNGKEPENPLNLLVAATLEKAITYVFAESPVRNAEARSSTLLCSTNNPPLFN
jgi:hypothetical protein